MSAKHSPEPQMSHAAISTSLPFIQWKNRCSPVLLAVEVVSYWLAAYAALLLGGFDSPAFAASLITVAPMSFRLHCIARKPTAVVLGAGNLAEQMRQLVGNEGNQAAFRIAGFVATGNDGAVPGTYRVNKGSCLRSLLRANNSNILLVALDGDVPTSLMQELLDCKLGGINIVSAASLVAAALPPAAGQDYLDAACKKA